MVFEKLMLILTCLYVILGVYSADGALKSIPERTSVFRRREIGYFTDKRVVHKEAIRRCRLWHGTLLAIKNRATQRHVVANMPVKRNCKTYFYYIGLERHKSYWIWPDKTIFRDRLNFSNWRVQDDPLGDPCSREPNGFKTCLAGRTVPREQNATQISACATATSSSVGDWFDKDGRTSKWYYICERPVGMYATRSGPTSTTAATTTKRTTSVEAVPRMTRQRTTQTFVETSTASLEVQSTHHLSTVIPPNVNLTRETSRSSMFSSTTPTPVQVRSSYTTRDTPNDTRKDITTEPTNVITQKSAKGVKTSTEVTSSQVTTQPVFTTERISYERTVLVCLEELSINNSSSCASLKSFQEDFSIQSWEADLSPELGRLFLNQNDAKEKVILLPGITINLYKVTLESELSELFNTSTEDNSRIVLPFEEGLDSSNQFFVDLKELSKISMPYAIVAADIKPSMWREQNLTEVKPARSFSSYNFEEDVPGVNSVFNFLPSNASILSFKLYVPRSNQSKSVVHISLPVAPILSLRSDNSAYKIERNRGWKIPLNGISYSCTFLDSSSNGDLVWSTDGCFTEQTVDGIVHCNCSHTTSFGVIVAVRAFHIPPVVQFIAIALEILTVLALTLTFSLLLWLRKSMHSDRTVMQINLVVSLLFTHIFFVLGSTDFVHSMSILCKAFAVLSQLFILTTALWMLNEGIVLYFKTYKNALSFNLKKVFPYLAAVAWGFPILYVALCAGIGLSKDIYLDKKQNTKEHTDSEFVQCWVGFENSMIYTVIVPLALVLVITTAIVIKTAIAINSMSRDVQRMLPKGRSMASTTSNESVSTKRLSQSSIKSRHLAISKHVAVALRAVMLLLPVLGITWVLAFFVNIPYLELPFYIMHTVVSGLQGVFIFYIYCVQNSQFRRVFSRKWSEISSQRMGTLDMYSHRSTKQNSHSANSQTKL